MPALGRSSHPQRFQRFHDIGASWSSASGVRRVVMIGAVVAVAVEMHMVIG